MLSDDVETTANPTTDGASDGLDAGLSGKDTGGLAANPTLVNPAARLATKGIGLLFVVMLIVLFLSGDHDEDMPEIPDDFMAEIALEEGKNAPPLGSAACTAPAADAVTTGLAPGSSSDYTIAVGGVERTFRLHLPVSYAEATGPLPLVLNFHGWGGSARSQDHRTGMSILADSLNADTTFIVAYPQAMGDINAAYGDPTPAWNGGGCNASPGPLGETCSQAEDPLGNTENYGAVDLHYDSCTDPEVSSGSYCNCCSCADDEGFVRAILELLQREHCIDRRRVYSTGMSYGGLFSYQLALSMPHVFAAVAPVAGGILKGFATPPMGPASGLGYIGVLDIHGWYDPWVPANDTHGCITGSEPVSKNDEFCNKNEEFCMKNEELCIQNVCQACDMGGEGQGYTWPSDSEPTDGYAQSNDGWYYEFQQKCQLVCC